MQQQNAILAINSLDRYISTQGTTYQFFLATWLIGSFTLTYVPNPGAPDTPIVGAIFFVPDTIGIPNDTKITGWDPGTNTITIDKATTIARTNQLTSWENNFRTSPRNIGLLGQYFDYTPYANSFTLQSETNYIYGYIRKIIVSQIQIQYNVPTINYNLNDIFYIATPTSPLPTYYKLVIPYGFYTPSELASVIQQLITTLTPLTSMTVTFLPLDGFVFQSPAQFFFPQPLEVQRLSNLSAFDVINLTKTYRVFGITQFNTEPQTQQTSFNYPNFLYTPYVDIYSDTLTNYQSIKDTNTTVFNQKGLIARVYLSGSGNIQNVEGATALGSRAFTMTADLNTPKIIEWTRDVTVTQIDIQVRDQYGELLPGPELGYQTEFQITLLCVEGE